MNFDWHEYFLLAKELSGDSSSVGNEEARMRSAISRAYYSTLIQARNRISNLTGKTHPRNSKKKATTFIWTIRAYFDYARESEQKQLANGIGEELKRFKISREMADYDDNIQNLRAELESALIQAERLIKIIYELK